MNRLVYLLLVGALAFIVGMAILFSRLDRRCQDSPKRESHFDCDMRCREAGSRHPDRCNCSILCGCHR